MAEIPTPYTAGKPPLKESAEELRARIPGWARTSTLANQAIWSYPTLRLGNTTTRRP